MAAKSINVREYHETDEAAFMHLMRRFNPVATFPDALIAVAEHGGKLVGYATGSLDASGAPVRLFYVLPGYAGRGIASRLFTGTVRLMMMAQGSSR